MPLCMCLWKVTKGEFLKRSWGHLGRNWDCATSTANEYSCILNVSVGPCGVLATFRYGAVSVFDNIRKCVTPKGPAIFKKSLRLFRLFSCNHKHKPQTSRKLVNTKYDITYIRDLRLNRNTLFHLYCWNWNPSSQKYHTISPFWIEVRSFNIDLT